MTLDQVIFKEIDYVYNPFQNRFRKVQEYRKNVNSIKDIVYDESLPEVCVLDTYELKEKSNKKRPLVFNIHGGGFVAGDKKYREQLCSWFATELNAFVVNINHGLGPTYHFEDSIKHVISAVNWAYDNAEKYNIDIENSIITGDSSGGYFSAQVGAITDSKYMQEKLECKPKFRFKGMLLNCGIYDVNKALSAKTAFDLTDKVSFSFTGYETKDLDKYKYTDVLSSLPYITSSFPKTCVIYAEKDIFCGGQGEAMIEKLKEQNVYFEELHSTTLVDNHTFQSTWTSRMAKKANNLLIDFAKRLLKDEI